MSQERERYSRFENERQRSRSRQRTQRRSRSQRSRSRNRDDQRRDDDRREDRRDGVIPVSEVEKLLARQQESLLDIVTNHRQEIDELVTPNQQNITFRKVGIGKQHSFNQGIISMVKKLKKYHKEDKYQKGKDLIKDILAKLEEQQTDLVIADSSKHSWLTVSVLRNKSNLPADIVKKVDKIENRLDRSRPQTRQNHGETSTNTGHRYREYKVQTDRKPAKGPEALLAQLQGQRREGKCTHCHGTGHYWRECSHFWESVQKSRAAAAAAAATRGATDN